MVIVQIDERIEVEINEIVSYIYIYIVYIRSVKFATSDTNLSKHLTAIKKIIDRESSWGKKKLECGRRLYRVSYLETQLRRPFYETRLVAAAFDTRRQSLTINFGRRKVEFIFTAVYYRLLFQVFRFPLL